MSIASHRLAAASCVLALGLVAPPARAQPQPPGLNWIRLPGAQACISAARLAERVEARVGRVLFASASEAGVFVDGHVAPAGEQGWDVVLELSTPDGEVLGRREMHFDGVECAVIDEAVALVIAVTLYPNTGLLEQGIPLDPATAASLQALFGQEPTDPEPDSLPSANPAPSPHADAPAAAPVDRAAAPSAQAPSARQSGWAWGVEAAAAGAQGHLPGLAGGVAARVWVTPPGGWPIEAGVVGLPEVTEQNARVSGRVRFTLLLGTLALCPWQPAWLDVLALCAGAEVGRLHVESEGFVAGALSSDDAVASVTGSARVRIPLAGALRLAAAVVLAVPLDQRRYTVQRADGGTETLFRIPQLATRAELGLALSL